MASRKFFHAKPSYICPTPVVDRTADHNLFEFEIDEADIYKSNESVPLEAKKSSIPSSRSSRKLAKKMDVDEDGRMMPVASVSLPMNIPDWSKILREEYRKHGKRESDEDRDDNNNGCDDDDGEEYYGLVPPHEYLAMRRGASFSVHEGIGRTLKGRDLRRVRNAIWKKVGFED